MASLPRPYGQSGRWPTMHHFPLPAQVQGPRLVLEPVHLPSRHCHTPLVANRAPALESQVSPQGAQACQFSTPHPRNSFPRPECQCPHSAGQRLPPLLRHNNKCLQCPQRQNKAPAPQRMKMPGTAPPNYPFPLSITHHPFLGLGKFIAGHIHQMRA